MKTSDQKLYSRCRASIFYVAVSICLLFLPLGSAATNAASSRLGVLLVGDIRMDAFTGLKKGLEEKNFREGHEIEYLVKDAKGDASLLAELANEIVDAAPDVAIACGGIEADALKAATQKQKIPVVFLAVSSSVQRGLVNSMSHPGTNFTGVDTNDTALTQKRLWLIRKMFPSANRVLIPSIPTITPSVEAVNLARQSVSNHGLDVVVLEAQSSEQMAEKAGSITRNDVDAIYIGLAAPVWQIEKEVFFEISKAHKIPIMGVNVGDLKRGAVASYAASRHDAGMQAARLVHKVLLGNDPAEIPVETPSKLEFVINKWVVDLLGLELPERIWRLANRVEIIEVR